MAVSRYLALFSTIALTIGGVVKADSISAINTGATNVIMHVNFFDSTSNTFARGDGYVGAIDWKATTAAPSLNIAQGSSFSSYCIEGTQDVYINGGPYTWNIDSDLTTAPVGGTGHSTQTIDANRQALIQAWWGAHFADAGVSDANSAAFQLGLWQIVYNGEATVPATVTDSQSHFYVDNVGSSGAAYDAVQTANHWLSGNFESAAPAVGLTALTSSAIQDQILQGTPAFGATPTPLPAAAWGGMATLAGMAGLATWRRQRAA